MFIKYVLGDKIMEKVLKVGLGTFLVLEILALLTHLDVLMNYVGNIFGALVPIFIMIAAIIWMVKSLFR